jgi:hypothetical protein
MSERSGYATGLPIRNCYVPPETHSLPGYHGESDLPTRQPGAHIAITTRLKKTASRLKRACVDGGSCVIRSCRLAAFSNYKSQPPLNPSRRRPSMTYGHLRMTSQINAD